VVIFQNVTIGSNMRYNKSTQQWENLGNPIIAENVVVSDGAKVLGPIVVGKGSVVGAGAIVTRDVPPNTVVVGVNRFTPKDPKYDLAFNSDMIKPEKIIQANKALVERFRKNKEESGRIRHALCAT
jgi:serine O-acetyltransferase